MYKDSVFKKLEVFKKPITIEEFIKINLYDQNGYYSNSNTIGKDGDFITSPEISQLFGEIIGLYILDSWQKNIKKKFNLVELGPGKGTLLIDILKITEKFEDFNKFLNINLIEKNTRLIEKQKSNLINLNIDIDKIKWTKDFKQNFKEPLIIIANEFFDCFPIQQFYKKNDTWYQKMVKYNSNIKVFSFIDIKVDNKKTLKEIEKYNPLNLLEISKSREKYFSKICKKIETVSGMMIIIDYGYLDKPTNFTLQSVYNNKHSHVLDNIGCQDITSFVDFQSLISIAKSYSLKIDVLSTQREFLIQNGIYERKNKILKNCNQHEKKTIINGLDRIINENNMGSIFKVLVISKQI